MTDVGFTPDEAAMYSVSSDGEAGRIVITPLGASESRVFSVDRARLVACHPAGSHLVVVDHLSRLLIVNMASGRVERTRLVGGRREPTVIHRQIGGQVQQAASMVDPDAWEQQARRQYEEILAGIAASELGPEGMETLRRQVDEHIAKMHVALTRRLQGPPPLADQSAEIVFRARFQPTGDRLCLATSGGVRVYEWRDMMAADGLLPAASFAVDVALSADRSPSREGDIHDLDIDPARDRLLFGGRDGQVRFLDLASGRSGIFLEPPGSPPIERMALSGDQATLGLIVNGNAHSRVRRGPLLQFWDYEAISRTV